MSHASSANSITCLMTCYNEGLFVEAAITSVLRQSRADAIREILVVNDGSTDGSRRLLDEIALANPKVRVFHLPNGGLCAARNFGLEKVQTPFVAILDGDDIWHPDKIDRQIAAIAHSRPDVALWYSDYWDFSTTPEDAHLVATRAFSESDTDTLARYFVFDAPIVPSTAILRMSAVREIGGFDESVKLFEDMDICMRFAAAGYRFQHLNSGLVYKRNHPGGLSRKTSRWEAAFEEIGARWAGLRPELTALLPRRRAYRLSKIAQQYFLDGKDKEGWRTLRRAFRIDPARGRIWAYGLLAIMPYPVRMRLTAALKRMIAAWLRMLRR